MNASSAVTVRPASSEDKRFVLSLAHRFAQTRAAWRAFEEVESGTVRALTLAFESPATDATLFIACDGGGERIGFAYAITEIDFFTSEPHGHLSEIATVADGSGAAAALMEAAERWSQARGHRYLSLNVNDENPAAHAIYTRRDYVPEYRHLVKLFAVTE